VGEGSFALLPSELVQFLHSIGISDPNPSLWIPAFTHRSYAVEKGEKSYESLEFLGDAILNGVVSYLLFKEYPHLSEGDLSFYRSVLIRRETLADLTIKMGLHRFLRIGGSCAGLDEEGYRTIYADLWEAFVGAYFLSSGWDSCVSFLKNSMDFSIPRKENLRRVWDPKSVFQEYLARQGVPAPVYEVLFRDREKTVVELIWEGGKSIGEGRNRKEAERDAARKALLACGVEDIP
jgi:ribonuclease-3